MEIIKELKNSFTNESKSFKKYFLLEDKNKKYFMKRYTKGYDQVMDKPGIKEEFWKAEQVYSALKGSKIIKPIKPISFDEKKREIIFEFTEHTQTLRDKAFQDGISYSTFRELGKALASIHAKLNKKIEVEGFIYGDFSLNNILVGNNCMHLADFELNKGWKNYKGPLYRDLAAMSYSCSAIPAKKILSWKINPKIAEYWLLRGYDEQSKEPLDYGRFLKEKYKFFVSSSSGLIRSNLMRKDLKYLKLINKDKRDYRNSYQNEKNANKYDKRYNKENIYTYIWENFEKDILTSILKKNKGPYLDFACGSGRVLRETQDLFPESYGLDISKEMLDLGRYKIHSKLIQGDVTREYIKVPKLEVITAFRFFLNAHNSLRHETMFHLSKYLQPGGKIILNVHGNIPSIYLLPVAWRKIKNQNIRSLSKKKVAEFAASGNMKIVGHYGCGFFPIYLKKIIGRNAFNTLDKFLQKTPLHVFGMHRIYVCKKLKEPSN